MTNMPAERTPLAVLASAMADQGASPSSGPNPYSVDFFKAASKRKRTVACGRCDACCRDDCGACLNCLDKPKFGGNGIRKQSCLERKCRQPTAAPPSAGGAPAISKVPSASSDAVAKPANLSMPPQEWDAFWGAVECCMLLQAGAGAGGGFDGPGNKRARTNRCGQCVGCNRGDCGTCKNCRDKPKFGGPGIKKQACVRRSCCNPLGDDGRLEDEDDDEDDAPPASYEYDDEGSQSQGGRGGTSDGVGGFMSGEPSPELAPAHSNWGAMPSMDIGASAISAGGKGSMMEATRRRLQAMRDMDSEGTFGDDSRPDSSLSMGYSTADD